ncbi:RNA methyltransferase [Glaciimonas immobilis]|uniref:tRNA (cytidine/uridine-2'-O-)-methyltransferase TrmJ n=1 Tax=Glaciimonas immobilis TaxID=728004 RepID=A0A840RPE5_9BURK|nr:RNA methyltransferase [Glaciimonas immobilis]KAF3999383.1 RNA methyltransferase [Glaciimonas immobilis]MBB5198876.1 tRNA/rRNA methyltransferase [Glaciimonas immobilis]
MNLTKINTSLFNRLRFVLVDTSSPGNVGAAARAIKTMGFSELVLVNPRYPDVLQREEAIALASGAQDILASARIVETVEQALDGCNFAAALSARLREFSPPVSAPRAVAIQLAKDASLTGAILFGSERYGLPNEIVEKCNVLINIPANPDYSSLNLSQAVQVLAYECRVAASLEQSGDASAEINNEIGFHGDTANLVEIEGMFAHLEKALIEIDFLDPAHPKKLMPRLKRLFSRARLETEEVNILRGIASQILTKRRRLDR